MRLFGHLPCQGTAHIAGQGSVDACRTEYVVNEHGGGGLSVGAGDAYHAGRGIAAAELYLGDYGDTLLHDLDHHRGGGGDAGRFDHLGGVEDKVFGVAPLLEGDAAAAQLFGVARRQGAGVGEEYVHPFGFAEDGGSDAALTPSEHHQARAGGVFVYVDICVVSHAVNGFSVLRR